MQVATTKMSISEGIFYFFLFFVDFAKFEVIVPRYLVRRGCLDHRSIINVINVI